MNDATRATDDAELQRYEPVIRAFFLLCPLASWEDFERAVAHTDAGRDALAAWRRARAVMDGRSTS
jgi:hypothetical protein